MVIFHCYLKLPEGKLAGKLSRLPSHRHPWVCAPHPSWSLLWRQRFRCPASRDSNVLAVEKPGNLENRCQDVSKTWKLEHICQGHLVAYYKLLSKYWMEVSTNVGNVEPEKLGGKLSLSRKSQLEKHEKTMFPVELGLKRGNQTWLAGKKNHWVRWFPQRNHRHFVHQSPS